MKKRIFFIALLSFFALSAVYSERAFVYFGGLYSYELGEEKNIHNWGVGAEIFSEFFYSSFFYCFGTNYNRGNNDNNINLFYNFYPVFIPFHIGYLLFGPAVGVGTNVSYNISQNIFGIGPQADLAHFMVFGFIKINITYRYNIYFEADNSHEFEFKISLGFLGW